MLLVSLVPLEGAYAKQDLCGLLLKKGVLHPSNKAYGVIESFIEDEYGIYFKLNVGSPSPDRKEVYELLGYSGYEKGMVLPYTETINQRLKAFDPKADISFIALNESTVTVMDYIRYIGQKTIPVGIEGQLYHDLMDHATGYYLLSKTPYWQDFTSKISELFKQYDQGLNKEEAARRLRRINNFLEALTPAIAEEYSLGDEAFDIYIESLGPILRRL